MKDNNERICVIVPCYNGEKYLKRCIDSLLRQTYPVEVLIVNDGSTDRTLEIAQRYADQFDSVVVVSKENRGLPQARKTGVQNTDCKYIGFVDADDWVEPRMYEDLLSGIHRGGRIACCNMVRSYSNGETQVVFKNRNRNRILSSRDAMHEMHIRKSVSASMCNKLFYRSDLAEASFPKGNFIGEDYVTLLPMLLVCKKVFVSDQPYYHYWQDTESMSRGGFRSSHYRSYKEYRKLENDYRLTGETIYKDIIRYLSVEYLSFIVAMSRNNRYDQRIISYTKKIIRYRFFSLFFSKMDYKSKAAVCLCAVNEKVMIFVYRLISKVLWVG